MPISSRDIEEFRRLSGAREEDIPWIALRLIYLTTREINRLRDLHGLPQFTAAQVVQAIKNVDLTDEPQV